MIRLYLISILFGVGVFQGCAQEPEKALAVSRDTLSFKSGQNWDNAMQKLFRIHSKNEKQEDFCIVHIGDSHIQGDYFSGEIRNQLQSVFGNAGRGILFPYSLCSSFGPRGCTSSKTGTWSHANWMTSSDDAPTGLSGYGLFSSQPGSGLSFSLNEKFEDRVFSSIKIYHSAGSQSFDLKPGKGFEKTESANESTEWTVSTFTSPRDTSAFSFSIQGSRPGQTMFNFYGFEIVPPKKNGLKYHHCGVVGAQFSHFIKNQKLAVSQLTEVNPDLIIFSFGTNDAYNCSIDTIKYLEKIEKLLNEIKIQCPNSEILLMTAPDSRSQGKNPCMQEPVNRQLIKTAIKNNYSYYNLNKEMGGWGSIYSWFQAGFAMKDYVHFNAEGYRLQGKMFTKAFLSAYSKTTNDSIDLLVLNQQIQLAQNKLTENKVSGTKTIQSIPLASSEPNTRHPEPIKNSSKKTINKTTPSIYKIRKGDSIYEVAKAHKLNYKTLLKINNLKETTIIQPGQKIRLK